MTVRLPAIPPDAILWRVDPTSGQPTATTFHRRRRWRGLALVLPLNRGASPTEPKPGVLPSVGVSEGPVPVSPLAGAGPAPSTVSEGRTVLLLRPGAAARSSDPYTPARHDAVAGSCREGGASRGAVVLPAPRGDHPPEAA